MLGYILLGAGVLLFLIGGTTSVVKNKANNSTKKVVKKSGDMEIERSSNTDKPAPAGFADHYELIIKTAPTADPAVREQYAIQGFSESDILVAERKRLEKLIKDTKQQSTETA